jgi:hypothetical protein
MLARCWLNAGWMLARCWPDAGLMPLWAECAGGTRATWGRARGREARVQLGGASGSGSGFGVTRGGERGT